MCSWWIISNSKRTCSSLRVRCWKMLKDLEDLCIIKVIKLSDPFDLWGIPLWPNTVWKSTHQDNFYIAQWSDALEARWESLETSQSSSPMLEDLNDYVRSWYSILETWDQWRWSELTTRGRREPLGAEWLFVFWSQAGSTSVPSLQRLNLNDFDTLLVVKSGKSRKNSAAPLASCPESYHGMIMYDSYWQCHQEKDPHIDQYIPIRPVLQSYTTTPNGGLKKCFEEQILPVLQNHWWIWVMFWWIFEGNTQWKWSILYDFIWLVVWLSSILFSHKNIGNFCHHPLIDFQSYFSEGWVSPTTNQYMIWYDMT